MDRIDFRSDTVTWPTEIMRQAMLIAPLGDDVYGEDPTINGLQRRAAELTGKEAALFVASGTMGNLAAIFTHANRGDEAILGDCYHTYAWEGGSIAGMGGVMPHPLPVDRFGQMSLAAIEGAVRGDDAHLPTSRLILLENSVGGRNGYPITPDYFADVRQIADKHGLTVHLDGARLFNAAVALGLPISALTENVDTVSFCLSKGLCAPVGSMLCGSAEFIHGAHRIRKQMGGGMRQAGMLAAAGLVALDSHVERLADDHANARRLAEGLAKITGISVDLETIKTNIVFFELDGSQSIMAETVADKLSEEHNVWLFAEGARKFRAVTHLYVDSAEVDHLLSALRAILTE